MRNDKDLLREQLAALTEQHLAAKPDAVTLYAAQRKPDRAPWRKRPSLLDDAFNDAIEKARSDAQKREGELP